MDFDNFSKVYDLFMDKDLYQEWLAYVEKYLSKKSSILELGCGSGHLGNLLNKSGFKNTGLDLSEEMLVIASDNQREVGVSFPLIHRDMTDLSELGTYDHVISFSDSLCYLKNEKELKTVFEEVHRVLHPGGLFLFDVHSPLQVSEFKDFSYHDEREEAVFLWDSYLGEEKNSVEHDLTFFIREKGNQYLRLDERHKERTYSLEVYKQLLMEAGFYNIEITSDFTDRLQDDAKRWFFKAKKR